MLRISASALPGGEVTLFLEGQVKGPWVDELRVSCEHFLAQGSTVTLDLAQVSFVDGAAVTLFTSLRSRGVILRDGSPFVRQLLGTSHANVPPTVSSDSGGS